MISDNIKKLKIAKLNTTTYRVFNKSRDPLNPDGSLIAKGRYNDGTYKVLYTSQNPETAVFEKKRQRGPFGLSKKYKLAQIKIKLNKTVNLTLKSELKKLGISKNDLLNTDYSTLQLIGKLLKFQGIQAIIVPSTMESSVNIVINWDNLQKDQIKLIKSENIKD